MWRKASRMAGGKLAGCKERGEWAELYFMTMAVGLGMKVSAAVWGFGKIRRWSGEWEPGGAGAGEVHDLQAEEWGVQLECDGAAAQEV